MKEMEVGADGGVLIMVVMTGVGDNSGKVVDTIGMVRV